MTKIKSVHLVRKAFQPIPLLALTLVFAVVCIISLRANNDHMGKLRAAVYAADKNNGNVTLALQNLQAYVTHNMNTSLSSGNGSVYPPIQLKYTYQRLLDQESDTVQQSNSGLYTDAQAYCQNEIPSAFSGRTRVPCIEQYIESHDSSLPTVSTSLYEFSFISPKWSPDLAGYSLIATTLSGAALVVAIVLKLYRLSKA
jgi:hypothetical protein